MNKSVKKAMFALSLALAVIAAVGSVLDVEYFGIDSKQYMPWFVITYGVIVVVTADNSLSMMAGILFVVAGATILLGIDDLWIQTVILVVVLGISYAMGQYWFGRRRAQNLLMRKMTQIGQRVHAEGGSQNDYLEALRNAGVDVRED